VKTAKVRAFEHRKKSIVEMATFKTGRNARKLKGKKFQPTNEMML